MTNNQKQNNLLTGYRVFEGRVNVFCSRYVDIAVDNYYTLWTSLELIKRDKYASIEETRNAQSILENAAIVVVVFSFMAIESYLNDYAASCLGDDKFYDGFDKLNVLQKLRLIVQFIFRHEFVKDQPVYTHTKRLMADRNELVHNKSEDFHKFATRIGAHIPQTLEEVEECFGSIDNVLKKPALLDKESIKTDVDMANNAIKALRELALFFDNNDQSERAYFRLLGAVFYKNNINEFDQKKIEVFRQFQIPFYMQ